jgi:hypothetical protein
VAGSQSFVQVASVGAINAATMPPLSQKKWRESGTLRLLCPQPQSGNS